MKINKDFACLKFKDESELIAECEKLIRESDVLTPILNEVKSLKKGEVKPKDTKRRSRIGSYFTSEIQQIFNYLFLHKINLKNDIEQELKKIINIADAILRENIVLQSKSPIDVIKFADVPVRYSHSDANNALGRKERRWGYGLHKFPTTDQGYSITLALMPPKYTQSYHNHTIPEFCLILDSHTIGLIINPGTFKKKLVAKSNEILYFSATTVHTLSNPMNSESINITVKLPTGLKDWRPISNLNPIKSSYGEVLRGKSTQFNSDGGTKISFSINDKPYKYELEIIILNENSVIESIFDADKYFFVIDGDLEISSGDIRKQCSKNDYIVIDKNTPIKIRTKSKTRLYTVNNF